MTGRGDVITKHWESFVGALVEKRPEIVTRFESDAAVPQDAPSPAVLDGQVQKALVLLLKQKLDADPSINQRFAASTKVPLWNQLLAAARIKELSRARIVKKGGRKQLRYDIGDLSKTFFGKALIVEAGLARQKVLDGDELAKLQAACAKVKLTLPESIEPTTTELFFDETIERPAKPPPKKPKKAKAAP